MTWHFTLFVSLTPLRPVVFVASHIASPSPTQRTSILYIMSSVGTGARKHARLHKLTNRRVTVSTAVSSRSTPADLPTAQMLCVWANHSSQVDHGVSSSSSRSRR